MKRASHGCLATADTMGAQARAFWKEGESGALSVLNAFLGATCERPHETHKAKKTKTKVQKKENKEQSMCIFLWIYFKCGETNVSVYLYSSIRIIPSPIHPSSHAFRLLIFLLTSCSLHNARFLLLTWHQPHCSISDWLSVARRPAATSKHRSVSHWTNLAPQCGVNTTNAVLTLLRSRVS